MHPHSATPIANKEGDLESHFPDLSKKDVGRKTVVL